MPELPEVETIRLELDKVLRNQKIKDVEVRLPKTIRGSVFSFKKILAGLKLLSVGRRAKLIIINFSNNNSVIIHLKMTGQLVYRHGRQMKIGGHPIKDGVNQLPNKFTQVIFNFNNSGTLFFNDVRKFGYMQLLPTAKLVSLFEKSNYGLEPLGQDFTLEKFREMLKKKKSLRIKPLLMDQTFIAGIGNIYAVESCFAAGIRPTRRAGSLSLKEIAKLYQSIRTILARAIQKRGTSSKNYVDAYGNPGGYVPSLKVYGRAGKKCFRCGTEIKNMTLGGRGTAYCPHCQK